MYFTHNIAPHSCRRGVAKLRHRVDIPTRGTSHFSEPGAALIRALGFTDLEVRFSTLREV